MPLPHDEMQVEASSHQILRQSLRFYLLSDQQEFFHLNSQEILDMRSNHHDHHLLLLRGLQLSQTSSQEFLVLIRLH